jgi:hypothetical protein
MRLLAHELTHTLQQDQGPSGWRVQRDLLAYKSERSKLLDNMGSESGATTWETYTADAANVQTALQTLITANKIGVRDSGDRLVFFGTGANRTEVSAALAAAGFAKATEMADAILNGHNVSAYSRERVIEMYSLFGHSTLASDRDILDRQTARPLTGFERTEARLVFGTSLNLDPITVSEDPVMGIGGYARTTPWAINFPTGSFGGPGFMPWLIHELTHSWQYQHGVSLATTLYHSIFSTYDYGGEAGLLSARAAGKTFTEFNTERQGDILEDYYKRSKAGQNVGAWAPFANDVQSAP